VQRAKQALQIVLTFQHYTARFSNAKMMPCYLFSYASGLT
jgi:hypothetical protein